MVHKHDRQGKKAIRIGVKEGGGPPPGYLWNVDIVSLAVDEAMGFLNEEQYELLARQVRELARHPDPTHSDTVDVRPIESYHEMRDKGGILGKINARVFFFVYKETKTIVILGAIKKENNGRTPDGDRIRMRRRRRLYLEMQPKKS